MKTTPAQITADGNADRLKALREMYGERWLWVDLGIIWWYMD